jgi:hypothetical protein
VSGTFGRLTSLAVGLLLVSGPVRAETEAGEAKPPRLLGRLLGAGSEARVRGGLWVGGLSPGLFSTLAASDVVQPEGSAIGRGSGLVNEFGLELRAGDYDFAFSLLTDQLIEGPSGDGLDDIVARAVLRQLVGQLRTRALKSIVGTELALQIRTGDFSGPIDGTRFGFRNDEVWFGGRDSSWETSYLSVQLGAQIDTFVSDWIFLRYTGFSTPQLVDLIGVRPVGIQDMRVDALGVGFAGRWAADDALGPVGFDAEASFVPGTGLARFDYGGWGSLWGLFFEFEATARAYVDVELGGVIGLRPYAGFRADMLSPISGSFGTEDPNAVLLLTPDFLLWGPVFGLEVML